MLGGWPRSGVWLAHDTAAAAIPEGERVKVGEKVTHRLAQEPGSWVVLRYVSETFKRRDTGEVVAAPAPAAVLERSCADVSVLAGMIVDKLVWHLPLHRQRLEAAGVTLSRASLTSWLLRTTALLEPIFEAQCRSVLESAVLAMDEASYKGSPVSSQPGLRRGSGQSVAGPALRRGAGPSGQDRPRRRIDAGEAGDGAGRS